MSNETRNRFFSSQISILLLEICLFTILFISRVYLTACATRDPNWYETHAEASSTLEAERIYGDDLLFGKLVFADAKYHYRYWSTLEWEEGGSLGDRDSWRFIEASVKYYTDYNYTNGYDSDSDSTHLAIFFKKHDDPKMDIYRYNHYEHYFSSYSNYFTRTTGKTVINGVDLTYVENLSKNQSDFLVAKFEQDDYIYYYSSSSNQDSKLAWSVLEQLLSN